MKLHRQTEEEKVGWKERRWRWLWRLKNEKDEENDEDEEEEEEECPPSIWLINYRIH